MYRDAGIVVIDPNDVSDPNTSYYAPASSGRPECGCDEKTPDAGPIPKGSYTGRSSNLSNPGILGDVARNILGDWGDWRMPLDPDPGTKTYGRSGFFLHGGRYSGSAGCVDVGGGLFGDETTDRILKDIMDDPDGIIPVIVH